MTAGDGRATRIYDRWSTLPFRHPLFAMNQTRKPRIVIFTVAAILIVAGFAIALQWRGPDEPPSLERDGAFDFPQRRAFVLDDQEVLRVSAWNDAKHLYVQAIWWTDGDDTLGESEGRPLGDWSSVRIDADANGQDTAEVDRVYMLNFLPHRLGLYYQHTL